MRGTSAEIAKQFNDDACASLETPRECSNCLGGGQLDMGSGEFPCDDCGGTGEVGGVEPTLDLLGSMLLGAVSKGVIYKGVGEGWHYDRRRKPKKPYVAPEES